MAYYNNPHDWCYEPAVYGETGYYRTRDDIIYDLVVTEMQDGRYEADIVLGTKILSRKHYGSLRGAKISCVYGAMKFAKYRSHVPFGESTVKKY